jgi:hypothetical protein
VELREVGVGGHAAVSMSRTDLSVGCGAQPAKMNVA